MNLETLQSQYTTTQVADALGICHGTVFNFCSRGKIKYFRYSKRSRMLIKGETLKKILIDATGIENLNEASKELKDSYTTTQVADALGVCPQTVINYCNDNWIKCYRVGRSRMISTKSLKEFLDNRLNFKTTESDKQEILDRLKK